MTKQLPDFKKQAKKVDDDFYDLREDWALVEASLAKQYGIRIRELSDMPWGEFCTLVGGLMYDTPLGQVVAIRSEDDEEIIKKFNPSQRKIHSDWKKKIAGEKLKDENQLAEDMKQLEDMFSSLFGRKAR